MSTSQLAEYLGCGPDTARETARQAGFPVPVLIGKKEVLEQAGCHELLCRH